MKNKISKASITRALSILLSGNPTALKKQCERQISYWAETEWITPARKGGKGVPALYTPEDAVMLCVMGYLAHDITAKHVLEATYTRILQAQGPGSSRLVDALVRPSKYDKPFLELAYVVWGSEDEELPGFYEACFKYVDEDGETIVTDGHDFDSPKKIILDLQAIMTPLRRILADKGLIDAGA